LAKVKPIHYVDNEKFLKEMIIYKRGFDEAKEKDELPPMISEYLGECFMKIAQRLSFRPNFINYAFKDDMISDGIENCVQYIKNFNPEKSSNPFAYFTQIIYYAFIRMIQKEKKYLASTTEVCSLYVDLDKRKVTEFEDEKLSLIDKFIKENSPQFEPGELHLIKKLKK